MVGCFETLAVLGVGGGVAAQVRRRQAKKHEAQLAVLRRLFEQVLGRALPDDRELRHHRADVPAGANANVVNSLRAIRGYQDLRVRSASCASGASEAVANYQLPSFTMGVFKMGGGSPCAAEPLRPDGETAVCEELKRWLVLIACAGNQLQASEVLARQELYRQILMRPETFDKQEFRKLMATVCEQLGEMCEQLTGALRPCAQQIGQVLNLGRRFFDELLPVLLFGITDALVGGELPIITIESLLSTMKGVPCVSRLPVKDDQVCRADRKAEQAPDERGAAGAWKLFEGEHATVVEVDKDGDFKLRDARGVISGWLLRSSYVYDSSSFVTLWTKDVGRLIQALLASPHFEDLWGAQKTLGKDNGAARMALRAAGKHSRGQQIEDVFLDVQSLWYNTVDDPDFPVDQKRSMGLVELFWLEADREARIKYLDLYRKLDNFVMFLNMLKEYRSLSNIVGDAAMYVLRERLHHVMREIEGAAEHVFRAATFIVNAAKEKVIDVTLRREEGNYATWLDRLLCINETALMASYRGLLRVMQEVCFLSSEARGRVQMEACQDSLRRLSALADSQEFRQRCVEPPPPVRSVTFAPLQTLMSQDQEASASPHNALLWSADLGQQLVLAPDEVEPALSRGNAVIEEEGKSLAGIVGKLNEGSIDDPGDYCIVRQESRDDTSGELGLPTYVLLHKAGRREVALEQVGLNQTGWSQVPLSPGLQTQAAAAGEEAPNTSAAQATAEETHAAAAGEEPRPTSAAQATVMKKELTGGSVDACEAEPLGPVEPPSASSSTPACPVPLSAAAPVPTNQAPAVQEVPEEEQKRYYTSCFMNVAPNEELTQDATRKIYQRSGLTEDTLRSIFAVVMTSGSKKCVDLETFQALGMLVAWAQAGVTERKELVENSGKIPKGLPELRGLTWNGRKSRMDAEMVNDLFGA